MIPLIIQDSIDRETLQTFLDARKEDMKRPMTQRGVDMLLRKLARLEAQGHCPNLLLERSIQQNYTDVYPHESTKRVQSFAATHSDKSWANVSFIDQHTDKKWREGI